MSIDHDPCTTAPAESTPPRPFARSFWVAPGKLLAGYYPGDLDPAQELVKLRALLAAGVRSFVDLTHELDRDHGGRPLAPYTTNAQANTAKQLRAARGIALVIIPPLPWCGAFSPPAATQR